MNNELSPNEGASKPTYVKPELICISHAGATVKRFTNVAESMAYTVGGFLYGRSGDMAPGGAGVS